MKITICIGSSCHLKGSRQIVEGLQALVKEHGLEDKVEMGGRFCMGDCQNGVCLTVDDQKFSLSLIHILTTTSTNTSTSSPALATRATVSSARNSPGGFTAETAGP